MKKSLTFIIAIICLAAIAPSAYAAKQIKERLVLMPLRVSDDDKNLQGAMETALVEGLQQQYEVFSGEQVAKKSRDIFNKESRNTSKKECDETRCMQGIAEAFQAELIATTIVTKRADGYFLALNIQNVFDNTVKYSKSLPCKSCDAYHVVEMLKELSGVQSPVKDVVITSPIGSNPDAETILWMEVRKGNTLIDYTVYIKQYPNGRFSKLAQLLIEQLKKSAPELAVPKPRSVKVPTTPEMLNIGGGEFYMGTDNTPDTRERPAHRVKIKSFLLGRTEVNQAQWKSVMGGANPSKFSDCETCPVEQVSWDDVQQFIQKLNRQTGKNYRLPSEAEWEYACGGDDQYPYCGRGGADNLGWHGGNSGYITHPVAQKLANKFGLYDMSGNVAEWVQDCWNNTYQDAPTDGSAWLIGDCGSHVYRGGNYGQPINWMRWANRGYIFPSSRQSIIGFRLAHDR